MRHWNFLMIIALAVSCAFASCNNDDEPTITEEWKNGKVLVGEEYIPATTEFTDAEALRILTSSKWQYVAEYNYDQNMNYLFSNDYADTECIFEFNNDGNYTCTTSGNENQVTLPYSISNKQLKRVMYKSGQDDYSTESQINYYSIVSVDKERIVYDTDSIVYEIKSVTSSVERRVIMDDFTDRTIRHIMIPSK